MEKLFLKIKKHIPKSAKRFIRLAIFRLAVPVKRLFRLPLKEFRFNYFSQYGEDGIIEELFRRLSIKNGWVVEFGAWNGKHCSNTFHLLESGGLFRAVYIEGDKNRYQDLLLTAKQYPTIIPINSYVEPEGENSLENLFKKTPVPKDLELLSIDVDGIDYHLWNSLKEYRPKIVIIETDMGIPIGVKQIHGDTHRYSSYTSTIELGTEKGYTCVFNTGNLFFVRNDLFDKLGVQALK